LLQFRPGAAQQSSGLRAMLRRRYNFHMKLFAALAVITFSSGISGCGQKGPLVHADKHPVGASVAQPLDTPIPAPATEPKQDLAAP
jgi:predicted small lipoprotein YifL